MTPAWLASADVALSLLRSCWRGSRWTIIAIVLIASLSSVAAVSAPYIFSRLIDQATAGDATAWGLVGFFGYAAVLGISTTLSEIVAYLSLICTKTCQFSVSTALFARVLKKTGDFFINFNPAQIQSSLTSGEEALASLIDLVLVVFVPGLTQIGLSVAVIGSAINAEIVIVVVTYGCVFVTLTVLANLRTRAHRDSAIEAAQDAATFLGNAVNGMEELRHFGSEQWLTDRFSQIAGIVRDNWLRFCLRSIGYAGAYGILIAVEFAASFFILLPRYKAGHLSIGDIVLFNLLLLQLNHPFELIGHAIGQLAQDLAEFQPFARIWLASEDVESTAPNDFVLQQGSIEFDGVRFSYGNGRGVDSVSFVAERGRVTYLVGETGAGKSTIIRLALKSLEPAAGRILVDGTNLSDIPRSCWNSIIGIVPQDIILLNDTLRTNIVLGRPCDETRLRNAVDKAAVAEFVAALPERLETTVGERGLKLSGGERQRLAIARALYAKPEILFLDEASSALDEATEREIMSHIRTIAHEVTIVAITHRERLIMPGDRIVRMSEGRVVRRSSPINPRGHP